MLSFTVCTAGTAHALQPTTVASLSTTTTILDAGQSGGGAPQSGGANWLPEPLSGAPLWYGIGAVVLLILWTGIQSALRAFFGALLGNVRLLRPWRWRPLLQPSPYVTRSEIERTGRIPIEPTVNRRGRVGPIRRVVLSRIVPITTKPAFLLSTWKRIDGSTLLVDPGGFTAGGYQLLLRLFGTENRSHLAFSVGAVRLRATRVLLICTLENYLNADGMVHRCTIDWRRAERVPDEPDALIVHSADKLRSGGSNYEILPRSEVQDKGIWLVAFGQHNLPPPHQDAADVPGRDGRGRGRFRDRCRPGRRWWWPIAALGVLGWASLVVPPFEDYLSSALSASQFKIYGYSSLILGYFGSVLLWIRFNMFLRYEWRAPTSWTATTTRCLTDGAHVRNGMFNQLSRRDRYRILNVQSHDPAPEDASTAEHGATVDDGETDEAAGTGETEA